MEEIGRTVATMDDIKRVDHRLSGMESEQKMLAESHAAIPFERLGEGVLRCWQESQDPGHCPGL